MLDIQQQQTNMLIEIKELLYKPVSLSQTQPYYSRSRKSSSVHDTKNKIQLIKLINRKRQKKTFRPIFLWMGFYCLKDKGPLRGEETVYFLPLSLQKSWYSFDRPRKNSRLKWLWNHSVVLNTGPLDWKSSAFTTTVHSIISIQEEGDADVLILKKGIESSVKVTRCKRKITSRDVSRTMLSTCRKIDLKCVPVRRDCKELSGNNPQLEIRSFDESDEEFSSVFWHFRNYLISSKTVSVYLPLSVLKSCYVVIFRRDIAETLI